jgi:urea transport system permease protein
MPMKSMLTLAAYFAFALALLAVPSLLDGDMFLLNKYSRFLALGLATAALALSWGYAGILNLGQGVSFGVGAYAIAMHLKLAASQSNPGGLPDFMGWNNIEVLPWFWEPFHSLGFAVFAGIAVPVLLAAVMGWFMFRARISGVFVAIITLAMLSVFNLMVINQQRYTGGANGMTDLAWIEMGSFTLDPYSEAFFYLTAGLLIICLFLGLALTRSKFGLVLQAIRDNEERVRYFGYDVARYQAIAFSISAGVAGLAGMLYAVVLEFASPTFMAVPLSLSLVIWAAVGGRQSLLAAAIGAIGVNYIQGNLSESLLDTAQLVIGGIFVLVVLFLPQGIGGLVTGLSSRFMSGRGARQEQAAVPVQMAEPTSPKKKGVTA